MRADKEFSYNMRTYNLLRRDFMKHAIRFLFIAAILIASAGCAFAKPDVAEYRNKDADFAAIKTVLVMPVIYETTLPQNAAFLPETIEQKWRSMTKGRQDKLPFLVKEPKDVVERDSFVKGRPAEAMPPQQTAEKALVLASQYVDGILMCTVTKAGTRIVSHPGEYVTKYRYVDQPVWRNNRWETERVSVPYQEYKQPWDEEFTEGAVKLELRSAKDNTLIYGNTVSALTGDDLFVSAPSLQKHMENVIENAAKRIPAK